MAKENIDPKKAAEVRNQLDAAAAAQERAATSAKKYTDQLEKALESIVHINESGKQTEKDLKKRYYDTGTKLLCYLQRRNSSLSYIFLKLVTLHSSGIRRKDILYAII